MAEATEISEANQTEPRAPGLRFLEAAVYIMGGLLVLMVLGLLGGIAYKIAHKAPPEQAATRYTDIGIPEAASVAGITLDGDRMAVHVVKGAEHEIIIVDTRKGAVLSRVRVKPGVAAGQ
jgi:hypothetical protein